MEKALNKEELELRKAFIEANFFEEENFDVDKATNYILTKYDIVHTPKQGYFLYNNKYWENVEGEYIGKYLAFEMEMLAKPYYIKQILEHLTYKRHVELKEINSNRKRIVLKNGTLDLSDWINPIFYENEYFRDDYSTLYSDWSYIPDAECPAFRNYLNTTFKGYEENINIIQEMLGYCLTTNVKFEKIFVLYGEGGSGKSVLIDTLKTLIGEANYSTVPMSLLSKSFLRAGLKDKTLNFSTEESSGIIKDTAWIKAISSGDPIEAQFKNKDTFNFNPFCKLVYAMNDLPQIENFDKALQRRFLIIPFKNLFRGESRDLELKEGKLHKEMDGILQFALEGLKRLAVQNDFSYSKSAQEQLENYSLESNHAERFAETFLTIGNADSYLRVKDIYPMYCDFCKENNEKPFKNFEFCKIIKRKFGLPEKREQKKFKGDDGKQKVEEVFNGLIFKDYSDNDIEVEPEAIRLCRMLDKMKEDSKKNVISIKKYSGKKEQVDISSLINEI